MPSWVMPLLTVTPSLGTSQSLMVQLGSGENSLAEILSDLGHIDVEGRAELNILYMVSPQVHMHETRALSVSLELR